MDDDEDQQINTEWANDLTAVAVNGSNSDYLVYADSVNQWVTIDGSWTIQKEFRNEAGDKITWSHKGPWKPTYVRKPKKTVKGEYETGKLYKRTHTVTIDNDCMEEPQTITVTEWATVDDILEARLGGKENGC